MQNPGSIALILLFSYPSNVFQNQKGSFLKQHLAAKWGAYWCGQLKMQFCQRELQSDLGNIYKSEFVVSFFAQQLCFA